MESLPAKSSKKPVRPRGPLYRVYSSLPVLLCINKYSVLFQLLAPYLVYSHIGDPERFVPSVLYSVHCTLHTHSQSTAAQAPGHNKKHFHTGVLSILSKIKIMGTYWASKDAEFHVETKNIVEEQFGEPPC